MNQYTELRSFLASQQVLDARVIQMLTQLINVAEMTRENKNIPSTIETLVRNLSSWSCSSDHAFDEYLSKVGDDSATVPVVQRYRQETAASFRTPFFSSAADAINYSAFY